MKKVHWSDKNTIAVFEKFRSVRLLQGSTVSKCDLRYRDLRYQIDKTIDLVLLLPQHTSKASASSISYYKSRLCFHVNKVLSLTFIIGQGQEMH